MAKKRIKYNGDTYVLAKKTRKASAEAPVATPVVTQSKTVGDNDVPGRLVQYYTNGPGFTPTTRTVASLPAGIYQLQYVNRQPTLVPHGMVTDNLLRLPDSKSDEVINEIERFWTLKKKFAEHGYVTKRGFLLWGPPGSGKTATVATVAKEVVEMGGIVILANGEPRDVASMLKDLRQVEPNRKVACVVEDIDATVRTYGETDTLALLDGEFSVDNIVFVATTNYPERLDRRLINRPSRFDKVVNIGMPNAASRRMYLESRDLNLDDEELNQWVQATEDMSIAHLKELIVSVKVFGNKFADTVERLAKMATDLPDSEGGTYGITLAKNRRVNDDCSCDSPRIATASVADAHDLHTEVGRKGR